ncbi:zinc finger protein 213 [Anopheles gambiae]|uniref:zinc finger protein 213 n=1 Tax=Anopheles gambiae TaxID=7165 RepID=UPI002AC8DB1A|nr:zinc finger protein 213 [Anopheles gambiae]
MPRSLLSQRYNDDLFRVKQHYDAEFCRLFWNPFADTEDDNLRAKSTYKPKGTRKKMRKVAEGGKHRCYQCRSIFRWPSDLKYHIAFSHNGEQLNVCPEATCGQNFQFPFQLVNHQRTFGHHDWQIVCTVCNKLFGSQRFLSRHTQLACNRYKQEQQEQGQYSANM